MSILHTERSLSCRKTSSLPFISSKQDDILGFDRGPGRYLIFSPNQSDSVMAVSTHSDIV